MVEETIDAGTWINRDSGLRGAFSYRICYRVRCSSCECSILQPII